MPTYSYACTQCQNRFDVVQAFTDDALSECPECGSRLRKLFGNVGVVFKGSGFYRTDARREADGKPKKVAGESGGSGEPAKVGASSSGGSDGASSGSGTGRSDGGSSTSGSTPSNAAPSGGSGNGSSPSSKGSIGAKSSAGAGSTSA